MLPRQHRLTRPEDFRRTIRSGRKAALPTVIVHGLLPAVRVVPTVPSTPELPIEPVRVGITVSKSVGGSVVRHRVARQIRHALAAELSHLPAGSTWVIRATPEAGASGRVASDVRLGVQRVLGADGPR